MNQSSSTDNSRGTRCFLHIGAPKTGTTLLQQLCWENRKPLLDAGILYPASGARRGGHHDYAFLMDGGYPEWATPQPRDLAALEADLAEELRRFDGDILLSSEDFYMYPHPGKLLGTLERTGVLKRRNPRIIVYLRRQDDAHESWYNQTIKALGYHHTLSESLQTFHDLWDYDANLQRWSAVFGEDALIVRLYGDREFTGGTLVNDFLSVIGVPVAGFKIPAERINTGLNYDLLEMQRCINRLPLTVQEKRRFHKSMIELSLRAKGTGLFDESPALDRSGAAAIMASYADGNRRVAERYLGRADLFSEPPDFPERDTAPRTGVTPEKIMYLLGWILSRDA